MQQLLEKLELADQKLAKQAETLPTVEAEVQQRLKALSQVLVRHSAAGGGARSGTCLAPSAGLVDLEVPPQIMLYMCICNYFYVH